MSTNIKLSLDKRRKKKDGTFPLIFRLTHKRKTTSISLGYSLLLSDWDEKRQLIKSSSKIVAAHLEEHGISKKHLADKINRSRDYVYKVLERSYISTEDLFAISKALEHNFFWYFTEKLTDYPPTVALQTNTEEKEVLKKELEHFKKENAYLIEINKLLKDKLGEKDE